MFPKCTYAIQHRLSGKNASKHPMIVSRKICGLAVFVTDKQKAQMLYKIKAAISYQLYNLGHNTIPSKNQMFLFQVMLLKIGHHLA